VAKVYHRRIQGCTCARPSSPNADQLRTQKESIEHCYRMPFPGSKPPNMPQYLLLQTRLHPLRRCGSQQRCTDPLAESKRKRRDGTGRQGGSARREWTRTRFASLKFLHPSLFTVTYYGPLDHGLQCITQ